MPEEVTQILPVIDPNDPISSNRFLYYILEEPNSPSITPPNAIKVVQYQTLPRAFVHGDPDDFRQPYGLATYDHELDFGEILKYNLLPYNPRQRFLYDLWLSFDHNKNRLARFLTQFYRIIENDPARTRLSLAARLINDDSTLDSIIAMVEAIPDDQN